MRKICFFSVLVVLLATSFMGKKPRLPKQDSPLKLRLWMNAFIPVDLPGISFKINIGSHAGESVIPGPLASSGGFLTDQRGFSDDITASRRMQCLVEIDLTTGNLASAVPSCGKTVQLNPDDGSEDCTGTQETSGIVVNNYSNALNASNLPTMSFTLDGSASNPCYLKSPSITWNIPVVIVNDSAHQKISISFEGHTKAFPAYEMYAKLNDGNTVTIFQRMPEAGANPWSLLLSPDRDITVIRDLTY